MRPVVLLLITALLWNKIMTIKSQMSLLGTISTLKDAQELVDAYNEHDYIQAMIKLIEIKLKVNPPEPKSREEKELLLTKRLVEKVHPSYVKWIARKKLKKQKANETKAKVLLKHARLIQAAINVLNYVMREINVSTDYVISFLNEIKAQLEEMLENARRDSESKVINQDDGVDFENGASNDEADPELSLDNDKSLNDSAKKIVEQDANTTDKIHKNKTTSNKKIDVALNTVPKPLAENKTMNKVSTTPPSKPKNNSNHNVNKPTTNNSINKQHKCVKHRPIIYSGYQNNINPYSTLMDSNNTSLW